MDLSSLLTPLNDLPARQIIFNIRNLTFILLRPHGEV